MTRLMPLRLSACLLLLSTQLQLADGFGSLQYLRSNTESYATTGTADYPVPLLDKQVRGRAVAPRRHRHTSRTP